MVLTCHDHLVPFYSLIGFKDDGASSSTHGGCAWHQMRIAFK